MLLHGRLQLRKPLRVAGGSSEGSKEFLHSVVVLREGFGSRQAHCKIAKQWRQSYSGNIE